MRTLSAIAFFTAFITAGGCGNAPFSSPHATIKTAKTAIEQHDYRTFANCLSPKARDDLAAALVTMGRFVGLGSDPSAADAEKARQRATQVAAVCKKHGVEEVAPKFDFSALRLAFDAEAQKKEWAKRLAPVKDRIAFIADFLEALRQTSDTADGDVLGADATVRDLTTNGDTASATFEQTRRGAKQSSRITLRKIDGEWKIDQLPRLM